MTLQPIGDLARTLVARRQLTEVQAQLDRASNEMTTGLAQDRSQKLGGDYTVAAAIARDRTLLESLSRNVAQMTVAAGATQTALERVDSVAQELTLQLISPMTAQDAAVTPTLAQLARDGLETAVAALNTRVGGQTLLAGTTTDGDATVDAATLLGFAETAAAGQASVDDIADAIIAWFDDPAGFAAQGYLGGPPRPAVPVAQGETIALPQTAADPAQRRALAGLAIAALSQRLAVGGPADMASALQRRAGEILASNQADRATEMAALGTAEARLATVAARLEAEASALGIDEAALISADPFEAATALNAREVQMQSIYAITGRLSRLTLLEYLR